MGNLLCLFVGQEIQVQVEGITVLGELIHFQDGDPGRHIPLVLIMKGPSGNLMILRSWEVIKIS